LKGVNISLHNIEVFAQILNIIENDNEANALVAAKIINELIKLCSNHP